MGDMSVEEKDYSPGDTYYLVNRTILTKVIFGINSRREKNGYNVV